MFSHDAPIESEIEKRTKRAACGRVGVRRTYVNVCVLRERALSENRDSNLEKEP